MNKKAWTTGNDVKFIDKSITLYYCFCMKNLQFRTHSWQEFMIKKYAKFRNQSLSYILREALHYYNTTFIKSNISRKELEGWLKEYHRESKNMD